MIFPVNINSVSLHKDTKESIFPVIINLAYLHKDNTKESIIQSDVHVRHCSIFRGI